MHDLKEEFKERISLIKGKRYYKHRTTIYEHNSMHCGRMQRNDCSIKETIAVYLKHHIRYGSKRKFKKAIERLNNNTRYKYITLKPNKI